MGRCVKFQTKLLKCRETGSGMVAARNSEEGGMRSCYLRGVEFQFGKDEKVLEIRCTTTCMYLTPLNWTLKKMNKMVTFILYLFYQNFKETQAVEPGRWCSVVRALAHAPQGHGFDSHLMVRVCSESNQSMCVSHRCF